MKRRCSNRAYDTCRKTIMEYSSGKRKALSTLSYQNSLTLGQPAKLQRGCSPKPSTFESVNNLVQKDVAGLERPEAIRKIRSWMAEVHASNETNLPTRIAVEDYSWLLQNGFAKGLMELEQNIGRR